MEVGLLFGSFDPVHVGHVRLGEAALQQTAFSQVWYVLTPSSPAKLVSRPRLSAKDRLLLLRLALWRQPRMRILPVELRLPMPQYTADTLRLLQRQYPDYRFSLIMGEDNLSKLHTWKDAYWLAKQMPLCVYMREGSSAQPLKLPLQIRRLSGPLLSVSSTQLREQLRKKAASWLPSSVARCIEKKKFYHT